MRKKITTFAVAAALTVAGAIPAMAGGPGAYEAPADGSCVARGVQSLDGPTIAGAAKAGLVKTVILDHAFNNADGLKGLGLDFCDES